MTNLQAAYDALYTGALIVLGILLFLCLLRCVLGPRVADRIVAINMTGTVVIVIISILAVMMNEGYLVDVALIYAMLSFLAVVLLTKVYMGAYQERKMREASASAKETDEKEGNEHA